MKEFIEKKLQIVKIGSYKINRLQALLETIIDLNLFLMFIILDGSAKGKDPEKIRWFINEVKKYKQ